MLRKFALCVSIFLLLSQLGYTQDSLSLSDCHKLLEQTHPYGLKPAVYEHINQLNKRISNTNYLPKFTLNAKATYQSDVIDLNVNIPNVNLPSQSKDQYNTSIDISQVIYDGGSTKALKDLQEAEYNTNLQQVEVEIYQVKKQVNQLYFSILILEKNKTAILVSIDNLKDRIEMIRKQVEIGVLLKSNLLVLQSQLIKLDQSADELDAMLHSTKEALGILINRGADSLNLVQPLDAIEGIASRPELQLFADQKEQLALAGKLQSKENMPKLVGFGQAGYGKPGLNMLNDQFDTYYLVGVKLTWNIWDWNKVKDQRQTYMVKQDLVDIGEKTFKQRQQTEMAKAINTIDQLETAIEKDKQLVSLQKEILESYNSQLENGVITTTDYVIQLNEVLLAEIKLNTHQIQLIQAKTDKMYI